MPGRGLFVAVEGGDGSGKSTQVRLLAERLGSVSGVGVTATKEPGDTAAGAAIRALFLDPALPPMRPETEAMLMAADRAEHVARVVAPALDRGDTVVCDRFAGSSVAYQGWGRGLDPRWVAGLSADVCGDTAPDAVILIDVPAEVAAARVAARAGGMNRLDAEAAAFHDRVRAGFAAQAAAGGRVWQTVDGVGDPRLVHQRVVAALHRAVGSRVGLMLAGSAVLRFDGDHRFLSNFWEQPFEWRGRLWRSAEHAFQAAKARTVADADTVAAAPTPGAAKRAGRRLALRDGWDDTKADVMAEVLAAKFADPGLAAALVGTGDALLIEGNVWHDNEWGHCVCGADGCAAPGRNLLGAALTELRWALGAGGGGGRVGWAAA